MLQGHTSYNYFDISFVGGNMHNYHMTVHRGKTSGDPIFVLLIFLRDIKFAKKKTGLNITLVRINYLY